VAVLEETFLASVDSVNVRIDPYDYNCDTIIADKLKQTYPMRSSSSQQGFTLVEILIVVAIMGILLFVGLPAKLGADGVEEVVKFKLTANEAEALKRSAAAVKELCEAVDRLGF